MHPTNSQLASSTATKPGQSVSQLHHDAAPWVRAAAEVRGARVRGSGGVQARHSLIIIAETRSVHVLIDCACCPQGFLASLSHRPVDSPPPYIEEERSLEITFLHLDLGIGASPLALGGWMHVYTHPPIASLNATDLNTPLSTKTQAARSSWW